MQTHNSFSLRSRAFPQISRVSTRQRRCCYGASADGDGVLQLSKESAITLRPPQGASALYKKRAFLKEQV